MSEDLRRIYDDFITKYKNFARELRQTYLACRDTLPPTVEDTLYNAGTMQRDADDPIHDNIILADAHDFEDFQKTISSLPETEQTRLKADKVVALLHENGVDIPPERMGDILFKENDQSVNREFFYGVCLYDNITSNTCFFSRNIGEAQIISLPDVKEKLPKSARNLPEEIMREIDGISPELFKEIVLKRGLYHEAVHAALGTTDERKCDTFALLRIMKEHPNEAHTIWSMYNFARSKSEYAIKNVQKAMNNDPDHSFEREIKRGTMTYLMPETYRQMERYAQNPELLQGKSDEDLLRLTFEITGRPDFTHEQLTSFMEMCSQSRIQSSDLRKNDVACALIKQNGAENISQYLQYDTALKSLLIKQQQSEVQKKAQERKAAQETPAEKMQPNNGTARQSGNVPTARPTGRGSSYDL